MKIWFHKVRKLVDGGSIQALSNVSMHLAVEQMCGVIKQLVTESFGDQRYNLALECLQVLRATSAKENESEAFNNFMHQLKKECDPANPKARRRDFWQLLKDNRISLITKGEAEDSDVTAEESDKVDGRKIYYQ